VGSLGKFESSLKSLTRYLDGVEIGRTPATGSQDLRHVFDLMRTHLRRVLGEQL